MFVPFPEGPESGMVYSFQAFSSGLAEPWNAVGMIFYWISLSGSHQFSLSLLAGAGAAE